MCVLLCANSSVREWLDIPLARAYRQSLQICHVCAALAATNASYGYGIEASQPQPTNTFELDEAAQRRVMKRSAWLQAYCRYRTQLAQRGHHLAENGGSPRDWQKALDALAKTWGRILSLVGLRW